MYHNRAIAIISAERDDLSEFGKRCATAELCAELRALPYGFKSVVGTYKGVSEIAFVIVLPDNVEGQDAAVSSVLRLARQHKQESVLRVHRDGAAELLFPGSNHAEVASITPVGQWREITREQAARLAASTFDPHTSKYYAAR